MFTGIVENLSKLVSVNAEGSNRTFWFECPITSELKVDQSVSHDGICLTVTETKENLYSVTAIQETLSKTTAKYWEPNKMVNIERCLKADGRFDGHIVQGHVDTTGIVDEIHDLDGSYLIFVSHPTEAGTTVTKGSICLNGISLTVVDSFPDAFSVAIIPYTWEHTNLKNIGVGDSVNIEFDILGKYAKKMLSNVQKPISLFNN